MTQKHYTTGLLLTVVGLVAMLLCIVAPANAQDGANGLIDVNLTIEPYIGFSFGEGDTTALDTIKMTTVQPWWFTSQDPPISNGSLRWTYSSNVAGMICCPRYATLTNTTYLQDFVQVVVNAAVGTDLVNYGTPTPDGMVCVPFPAGVQNGEVTVTVHLAEAWNPDIHRRGRYLGELTVTVTTLQ